MASPDLRRSRRRGSLQAGEGQRAEPLTLRERVVLTTVPGAFFVVLWLASGLRWDLAAWGVGASALAFSSLFWPLPGDREGDEGSPRQNARALLRLPVFWLGAALLAYLAISVLNPHTAMKRLPEGLRLVPLEHLTWLPSAPQIGLNKPNPIGYWLLYAQPWLMTCALWVGLRSRRAWQWLLVTLAIGLCLWLGVAYYMDFAGFERILGIWASARYQYPYFFGTIVAKAHVGYFVGLGTLLCLALFFHFWRKARQRDQMAGPHWVFLICAIPFTLAELRVFDRGPIVFHAALWLLAAFIFAVVALRERRWLTLGVFAALGLGGLGAGSYLVFTHAGGAQQRHFSREFRQIDKALANWRMIDRIRASELALEFWSERPLLGWGAGSFRYFYLTRADRYPDLVSWRYRGDFDRETGEWKPLAWETDPKTGRQIGKKFPVYLNAVHNDWAQALMELGLIGFALLAGAVGWWFWVALRHLRQLDAMGWMLLGGCGGMLLTGLVDFHFTTPSIMSLGALLIVTLAGWASRTAEYARSRQARQRWQARDEVPPRSHIEPGEPA